MADKLSDRNRRLLAGLVERHHLRLRSWLCRVLPGREAREDLLQETFLAAIPKLERLEAMDSGEAGRFLIGVARNKVRRYWENVGRNLNVPVGDFPERVLAGEDGEAALRESERRLRILETCLDRLGGASRRLVQKRFFDGLPSAGIARQYGESVEGLRVRLFRIRRKLRLCMEQGLQEG